LRRNATTRFYKFHTGSRSQWTQPGQPILDIWPSCGTGLGGQFAPNHMSSKHHKSCLVPPFYQLCGEVLIFAGAIFHLLLYNSCVPPLVGGSVQPGLSDAIAARLAFVFVGRQINAIR
jgi:hypothetical protein